MPRFRDRRLLAATVALAIGLLVLVWAWPARLGRVPGRFHVQDPSFHFTFCAMTSGTNHTFFRGSRLLARLNQKF